MERVKIPRHMPKVALMFLMLCLVVGELGPTLQGTDWENNPPQTTEGTGALGILRENGPQGPPGSNSTPPGGPPDGNDTGAGQGPANPRGWHGGILINASGSRHQARVHAGTPATIQFSNANTFSVRGNATLALDVTYDPGLIRAHFALDYNSSTAQVGLNATASPQQESLGLVPSQRVSVLNENASTRYRFNASFVIEILTNATEGGAAMLYFAVNESVDEGAPPTQTWAYFDPAENAWVLLPTRLEDGFLVANTSHFSTFTLLARESPAAPPTTFWENPWTWIVVAGVLVVTALWITISRLELLRHARRRNGGIAGHRLDFDDVVENETRSAIIDLIVGEPGIHFNEIKNRLDLTPGVLTWHVGILEEYGILQKKRAGQYLLFFPALSENPIDAASVRLVKSETTLAVLKHIRDHPGTSQQAIARALAKAPKTISYHLDKLRDRGMIRVEKTGRAKAITLEPAVVARVLPGDDHARDREG